MNSQFHDEFVALTALFYSGELTDEEWALLQVHLAYCDPCRVRFDQYQRVTSDVIPAMAASAAAGMNSSTQESNTAFEAAERRLMGQLESVPAGQRELCTRVIPWRTLSLALAACALGTTCFIGAYRFGKATQSLPNKSATAYYVSAPNHEVTKANVDLRADLQSTQREVAKLQRQLSVVEASFTESKSAATNAISELQAEQTARAQVSAERDSLNQQLLSAQAQVQLLRDKSSSAVTNIAEQAAQVDALENKVHFLNAALVEKEKALDEKERMLSVDKDFLAHDRDIRDVIGARNLYIADIFDTGTNGKTAKPFGRIFYTQDRSLIFYGFDLDKQPGLAQAAAFQVWGRGSDRQSVNLGLFYQDDSHKRWVLRCNDEKMLARLNMVFVTVEPPGGSTKPTGRQLLRAYLQIPPNHP